MKKRRVRLTESQLHQIIKESVKRIISEANLLPSGYDDDWNRTMEHNDEEMAYLNWEENEMAKDMLRNINKYPSRYGNMIDDFMACEHSPEYDPHYEYDRLYNDTTPITDYKGGLKFAPEDRTEDGTPFEVDYDFAKWEADKQDEIRRKQIGKSYQKALDNADKRPLHRKGSLNRA